MQLIHAKNGVARQHDNRLRVVYWGMLGQFSIPPLRALLDAGYDVCAVIVPAARVPFPATTPDLTELKPVSMPSLLPVVNPYLQKNIVQIAWERDIPVFEVRRLRSMTTLNMLRSLAPDVGCVACFSRLLPPHLLELPRHGFFNVHPSLLPAYRGPAPLFWTFRDNAAQGVSIHVMDQDLDTGAVVAQASATLPDGITGLEADQLLATHGGQLLTGVLAAIQAGTLDRTPQSQPGPFAPWPTVDDFAVSSGWSARRIFNFMRVTGEWAQPYPVAIAGHRFLLASALRYAADEILATPYQQLGHTLRIQCNPGVLDAILA